MKILWDGLVLDKVPTGGVSRYCAELLRAQTGTLGHQALVACPPGAPGFPLRHPRLRQISLSGWAAIDRPRIAAHRPRLFHSCYYGASPLPGLPVVQIAYDFIDARFPALAPNNLGFVARQRAALRAADRVIAISETTRNDAIAFADIPEDRLAVIRPPLNPAFLAGPPEAGAVEALKQELTGGADYWLWVGPGAGYKNRMTFLRAFLATARKHDTFLVMAGGSRARLSELEIHELIRAGLLSRTRVDLSPDDARLRTLYAGAAAFAQSSLWEGYGIPLAEALCCGAPLLVSDIPVFREVAGPLARYADPQDSDAWVAALDALRAEAPPNRAERRAAALSRFPADAAAQVLARVIDPLAP